MTWLARLDTDVGEHGLLYASVSTGYKAGGTQDAGTLYKPETLTNYEVGSKSSFMDGHVTWNNAIYYEQFKNFQLSAPITYPERQPRPGLLQREGHHQGDGHRVGAGAAGPERSRSTWCSR